MMKRIKKVLRIKENLKSLKNGLDMLMNTNSEIKKDIELFTANILKSRKYIKKNIKIILKIKNFKK